jgi:hypothetical protein
MTVQTAPLSGYAASAQLNLRKYNIREKLKFDKTQRHGPIVILVGRRNTGKSFCLRDICWHFHKDVNKILVMSGTEDCSPFFADFVPPQCIKQKYIPDLATRVVNEQYIKCKDYNERLDRRDPRVATEDCRIMWILDDCMYDDKWARTELMRYIFTCGRHLKIFLIVTMQYPLGIPPALRGNVDAIFLMNDRGSNMSKMYEQYASGVFDNYNEFKMVFTQVTQDHNVLVIDQNTNSNRLQDLVYYYKAQDRGEFKMGSAEDWKQAARQAEQDRMEVGGKRRNIDSSEYQPGMNKRSRNNQGMQIEVFRS